MTAEEAVPGLRERLCGAMDAFATATGRAPVRIDACAALLAQLGLRDGDVFRGAVMRLAPDAPPSQVIAWRNVQPYEPEPEEAESMPSE